MKIVALIMLKLVMALTEPIDDNIKGLKENSCIDDADSSDSFNIVGDVDWEGGVIKVFVAYLMVL